MHYTPKQLKVMQFIRDFRGENMVSPTLEELADHLGVTKPTAFGHIEALIKKGALTKTRSEARSLEITDQQFVLQPSTVTGGAAAPRVPLVGRIAAGRPLDAYDEAEAPDFTEIFPLRENCYALRVEGDSMIEDGIFDGDVVIVERRHTASNGETVVAIVQGVEGDTATLKRFYREGGRYRLQPANSTMEPIYVDADRLEIRGVVRSVHRNY